jgi:hypothetical protein
LHRTPLTNAQTPQHAADIIGQKIEDNRWAIRRHGSQTSLGALKTIFDWKRSSFAIGASGAAAVIGGPVWAAIAGGLTMGVQAGAWVLERRIDEIDVGRGANREVAILYDIQNS